MYLYHLLHRDESELIRKIYESQKLQINKGDWVKIIQEEKSKYNIMVEDKEIAAMSRDRFKSIVKRMLSYVLRNTFFSYQVDTQNLNKWQKTTNSRRKTTFLTEDSPEKMYICYLP